MIYRQQTESGFSLVEVLVSITILLLVIVGPMEIISKSINSTNFSTEQVNAWFLAQEGLELAQKGRDDLVLSNFKFQITGSGEASPFTKFTDLSGKYGACFGSGCDLTVDDTPAAALTVTNCGVIGNCKFYLTPTSDSARASYVHSGSGNSPTPYTRVIKMERTPAAGKVREIKVTSTVTWRTGSLISSQKVEAVTYLFNVYDSN